MRWTMLPVWNSFQPRSIAAIHWSFLDWNYLFIRVNFGLLFLAFMAHHPMNYCWKWQYFERQNLLQIPYFIEDSKILTIIFKHEHPSKVFNNLYPCLWLEFYSCFFSLQKLFILVACLSLTPTFINLKFAWEKLPFID